MSGYNESKTARNSSSVTVSSPWPDTGRIPTAVMASAVRIGAQEHGRAIGIDDLVADNLGAQRLTCQLCGELLFSGGHRGRHSGRGRGVGGQRVDHRRLS